MMRVRGLSKGLAAVVVLGILVLTTATCGTAHHDRDVIPGGGGAVSSAEPAATEIGLRILGSGGNAADAAVAVALALAVVHPQAGNLGGGGFALVRSGGELAALDFRETAPAAADRDMYMSPEGEPVEGASRLGPLAAGVPGSPAGLFELHRRYGRLPWRGIVEPAVRLARDGFAATERLIDAIDWKKEDLALYPGSAAVWLPGGKMPEVGQIIRIPALARTLSTYADRGPEAITEGEIAAAIEQASSAHGGILTAADLAAYEPIWREPIRFQAFGWTFASMPLPSSGGIIVGQTLQLVERLDWRDLTPGSVERAHLLAEIWRRSYADRFVLGAPETTQATGRQLLDPAWLERRALEIDRSGATPSAVVRAWPGILREEPAETTHLSVVDGSGGMVALTTTLNGWFGCSLLVPEVGFLLNNEMDDFTTVPGRPNMFDLIQGDANSVRPGARMLSSMSPTIAWRGSEAIAIGSPGGSRIPTATAQVLLRLIVDDDPLQAAVDHPRFHHQWYPDQIVLESGAFQEETEVSLRRLGHVLRVSDWRVGEVSAVRLNADGSTEAAADPRGPGGAGRIDRDR
jgi:gamma-glutamyltranspeptidase/glutathione hydrolase